MNEGADDSLYPIRDGSGQKSYNRFNRSASGICIALEINK